MRTDHSAYRHRTAPLRRIRAPPLSTLFAFHPVKTATGFLLLLLTCCWLPACLHAQAPPRYSVSGTVRDAKTGETLPGATVEVAEPKGLGTTANEYGFYSLTLPEGEYVLRLSYSGYTTATRPLSLHAPATLDLALGGMQTELKEIVVTGEARNANVTSAQTGVTKLDVAAIKDVPVLFGERDVIKVLQLLPGVKSAGEGNSGFFVRGGGPDQNLILLDEAPVYNPSHLLGFFSTFTSEAIKNVTLYKGNPPAQYGGRLSSVLDVTMNDGDNQRFGVQGGIGLISSKLAVEGPIVKDRGSFLITGRRTYADIFLGLSSDTNIKGSQLYFYDLNAKANYRIGAKDRVFLSGYFGRDVLGLGSGAFGIDWGNATGTLRWNHVFSPKLFSNTSLIYSNFNYGFKISSGSNDFRIVSRVQDYNIKQEFQYFANPRHSLRFGVNAIRHSILPNEVQAGNSTGINNVAIEERTGWENAAWIGDDWKPNDKLSVSYGLRGGLFFVMGGPTYYTFQSSGDVQDSVRTKAGAIVATYPTLEPRISGSYLLSPTSSIKASYARNVQHIRQLTTATATTPTDRWIMSSNILGPALADQVTVGYYRNLRNNSYELSAETYYKAIQREIDYRDGAQLNARNDVEGQILFGTGRAYGLELLARKKTGRLTGWVGYTISRSERQVAGINAGAWYPTRQDRLHDVSVVALFRLNKRWNLSANFVYWTGNAVTFPSGKYEADGQLLFYYNGRNQDRLPAYHRLDLGATYQTRPRKRWQGEWAFSVYNAYGRENAFRIDFQQDPNDPSRTQALQTSLFRYVPSVSYNFKFK